MSVMKKEAGTKTRDILIIIGILVAIIIGISTQWALAGEMLLGLILR